MASMRKLRRRLLRWDRYAAKTKHGQPDWWQGEVLVAGHYRARRAVEAEDERRFWAETPEIWLGGPEGERALIADVLADDHPLTDDERRRREHLDACWQGCDDLHPDLCEYCEEPDCLGDCWGEEDASTQWPPDVITTTAFQEAGLL